MRWLMRIIAWRSRQPVVIRWLEVLALFGVALAARFVVGLLYGGVPALVFFPLLMVVTVLFGRIEAVVFLALAVCAGLFLFLPPGMHLLPLGWIVVGGFTIAIVSGLRSLALDLADANERQRILFQEVQHRVANTLQSVIGTLDIANRKIGPAPDEAKRILEEGIRRILSSANVHRRLNDPKLFEQGLSSILRDAIAAVIDTHAISVDLDVADAPLSVDQMSIITMLVIEFANNAQKHVFGRDLGSRFSVSLRLLPPRRAVLSINDDGPGWSEADRKDERTLGQTIVRGLANQLGGTLSVTSGGRTEINVEFIPVYRGP
jgi:two-component sensor histidine kinase